jgi:hypothetical protein
MLSSRFEKSAQAMPYWLMLGFFGPMRSLSEADKLIENFFLKPTRDLYYKTFYGCNFTAL